MNQGVFIDVTKIEPRLKHPSVFNTFDALAAGESLVLHNDHDPKPLYYQMIAERGNTFSWSYLKSGPEVWEVEIRKNVPGAHLDTVGEIAARDLRKAEVFKKYGIDFCCGGKKSLEEVCRDKGLDVLQVKEELENSTGAATKLPVHDFNSWNLTFLSDYIVNIHHSYVRQSIPVLSDLSRKVADHHGKTNPELDRIRDKVDEMISEINVHLKKEENILFPYIKQLEKSKLTGSPAPSGFGSVMQPISVMEHDHDIVGDLASEIRILSGNYFVPAEACNSYNLLYSKLEEFENDLHMHIHLENNVLFPKAVELERVA